MKSLEQQARDILERCGWDKAQSLTGADVCEVANLLQDLATYEVVCRENEIDTSGRLINPPLFKSKHKTVYVPF